MKTQLWKDFEEVKVMRFDFSSEIEADQTIATVHPCDVTLLDGADTSPANLLLGEPLIVGRVVLQRVQAGVPGATYHIRARATDSSDLVHVMSADLLIVKA